MGISASITDKGVYCQAFSDPHGRDELGSPFSVGDDVVFSSKNQKPVRIASFYCSDSVDKLEGPGLKPLSGKQGDGDDDKEKTVRIQFRTGYDKFTQGDIKLGEVVSLGKWFLFPK